MRKSLLVSFVTSFLLTTILLGPPIGRVSAAAGLSIDGSSFLMCSNSTTSCPVTLSTSNTNDVIIAFTFENLDTQTSCAFNVSDTAGLHWSLRTQISGRNDGTTAGNRDQIAEFWAKSSALLASDTVTESIEGCTGITGGEYNGVIVFGVSGANPNNPFDPNVSLPAVASGLSNSPSATISTSSSNDLIIGGSQLGGLTNGAGFNLIATMNFGNEAAEDELLTSPVSGFSVSFSGNTNYWEIIADAIQPGTANATPDFTLGANPLSLIVSMNSSGRSLVFISSLSGFSGTVRLSATSPQHQLDLKLSPTSISLTPGSSGASKLNVSTTKSTTLGLHTVTLTGKNGRLSHSITIVVTVLARLPGQLSLDGSNNGFCGNSTTFCKATLSTSNPNDILITYAIVTLNYQTPCTFNVSDTSGLTWKARSVVAYSADGHEQIQEFWTVSTARVSSDTVTESIGNCVGLNGGEYNGLMVFGISGANLNSPFDANVSLPAVASNVGTTPTVQLSTSNPNDMIIAAAFHGALMPTPGTGFSNITSNAGGPFASEFKVVNTLINNSPVTFADASNDIWLMIADAVQAA